METRTNKDIGKAGGAIQQRCPGCCHPQMDVFFEAESVPMFCNVLWKNRDEAIAAPVAPINLAYCHQCGLIYNTTFAPQLMEYSPAYENSLHFSPRFQKYAEDTANRLIQQYQLRDKDIIEIGCGHGDFLAMLQRLGDNRVLGFDPSYRPEKIGADSEKPAVIIVPETYSTIHTSHPVDFICCRHVLEHINSPADFLRSIRCTICQQFDCVVYFEVPNALHTIKDMGIWDIIYEHCSYFTSESLTNLFMRAGFEPIKVASRYDDQFLTIEARPRTTDTDSMADCERITPDTLSLIGKFHNAYQDKVNLWQRILSHLKKKESKVVLWGAGSKGITFLNALDISHNQVEYIVDLNPRKHGKFVAGTGQQVIAPNFLEEYQPHTVIIMNPVYHAEIRQIIQDFRLTPELLLA